MLMLVDGNPWTTKLLKGILISDQKENMFY
jgi:hypothetical protein